MSDIVCSVCGNPPSGKFHDGDKCAKCAKMQRKERKLTNPTPFYSVGDRVLVKRGSGEWKLASIRPMGKDSHKKARPEQRFVLVRLTEEGVDTQSPPDFVQLVYRPGEEITPEMMVGLTWLLKEKSQSDVARLLGIPPTTLSGALKRMRRSA